MGSRRALVTQKDVTRIVKGYAAAGITVGMTVKDGVPLFLPVDQLPAKKEPSETAREAAYRAWKARNAG